MPPPPPPPPPPPRLTIAVVSFAAPAACNEVRGPVPCRPWPLAASELGDSGLERWAGGGGGGGATPPGAPGGGCSHATARRGGLRGARGGAVRGGPGRGARGRGARRPLGAGGPPPPPGPQRGPRRGEGLLPAGSRARGRCSFRTPRWRWRASALWGRSRAPVRPRRPSSPQTPSARRWTGSPKKARKIGWPSALSPCTCTATCMARGRRPAAPRRPSALA